MNSRWLLFLPVLVAVFAPASGCGSDAADGCGEDACGGPEGSDDDFSSGQTSASGGPSTGAGAAGGDGNDTFETATPIELNKVHEGELTPTGDVDFYSFVGHEGQVLLFDIDAQDADNRPFDPSYIDSVLTVFDENHRAIAEAAGPTPKHSGDPQLYTILPAAGTYFIRIQECWQWSSAADQECALPEIKEKVGYALLPVDVEAVELSGLTIVGESEPNDEASTATPLEYTKTSGIYEYTDLYGTFASATDVDAFRFALPADTTVSEGRSTATFWPLPHGTSGNGSASPPGKIYVVDPAAPPGTRWAEVDAALGQRLAPPVQLDKEYLLFVEHPGRVATEDDFYFVRHYGAGSNPTEQADLTNGSFGSAEPLAVVDNLNGSYSYFVDGDIAPVGVDVDYFQVDASVAAEGSEVNVYCSAERRGSGLRELSFSLLAGSSGEQLAAETETALEDSAIVSVPLPKTESKLVVKVDAGSQAPLVSSTFYRCGIHFYPPP